MKIFFNPEKSTGPFLSIDRKLLPKNNLFFFQRKNEARFFGRSQLLMLGAGIACGALAMFLLDPQGGRRRRTLLKDKASHTSRIALDRSAKTARDLRNRGQGLIAMTRQRLSRESFPDNDTLVNRVRSEMGRVLSHPSSIEVSASDGLVSLSGPIPASEVDRLIGCVSSVRGVTGIENRLEVQSFDTTTSQLQMAR